MTPTNQPLRWQLNPDQSYIPISYQGRQVGFCAPKFAAKIVEVFNEDEKLQEENELLKKALQIACLDLLKQSNSQPNQLNEIQLNELQKQYLKSAKKQYLKSAKRPEHGTAAIAFLLRSRQGELDISDQEFAGFCNSYKLSLQELKDIYNGKEISDSQLKVLARILGKSVEELTEMRDGLTSSELKVLARILGTSPEQLTSEWAAVRNASITPKDKKK